MDNCVQCGRELGGCVKLSRLIYICLHPDCPNYGILAISSSEMKEMEWV